MALTISILSVSDVSCYGGNDGSANLTASGGTAPNTYLWSNGSTSEDISGLTAGTYTVTVTDSLNCAETLLIQINQPVNFFFPDYNEYETQVINLPYDDSNVLKNENVSYSGEDETIDEYENDFGKTQFDLKSYPNPISNEDCVEYFLPECGRVRLSV